MADPAIRQIPKQPTWMNKYLGGPYGVWAALAVGTVGIYFWHLEIERRRAYDVANHPRKYLDDSVKYGDIVKPYSPSGTTPGAGQLPPGPMPPSAK